MGVEEEEEDARGAARLLGIAAARRLRLFSHDLLLRSYTVTAPAAPAALSARSAPAAPSAFGDDPDLPGMPAPIRALYERAGRVLESVRSRVPRVVLYVPAAPQPLQPLQPQVAAPGGLAVWDFQARQHVVISSPLCRCTPRGRAAPTPRLGWRASAC